VPGVDGRFGRCDVCASPRARLFLHSPRLDGPLVRCQDCGHLFVAVPERGFTFTGADPERSAALADRVRALGIVDVGVEEAEAASLREATQRERLQRLLHHVQAGRLLDVGAGPGDFLAVAVERFEADGVEPDPATAAQAVARGLRVQNTTLGSLRAPAGGYQAVTMFHVIEHLDSPRAGLVAVRDLIAADGVLLIETPTVDSAFFTLAPARWRQLIPDHYHFFSRATLTRLLGDTGFAVVAHEKVGRRVSLRFAADRWRRAGLPAAAGLSRLLSVTGTAERTVRIVPGDIMEITARPR
jgi:SAM-dependent methyltransferase